MMNFVSKNVLQSVFEGFEYKIFEGFMRRSFWSPSASTFLFYFVYPMTSIFRPALVSLGSKNEQVELLIPCELNATNSMLYTFNPMRTHGQERGGSVFSFSTFVCWSNHGEWVEWVEWIMMNQY